MILITGASGLVGGELRRALTAAQMPLRLAGRGAVSPEPPAQAVPVGDIGPCTDWRRALAGVSLVVHLAARVHQMGEAEGPETLARYREVNTLGACRLASEAAAAGVRRFVFLSSIKAGEDNDPYSLSKREAEQGLAAIAAESGMELVIIRPPLVYGPGVKANFLRLLRLVDRGVPLPLASLRNARSLIFVGNLVDFIICCLTHPAAAGQTFSVSDDHDLSTPELIRKLAQALEKPARLWPCPPALLRLLGAVSGRSREIDRLCGSLTVDNTLARAALAWQPPFTVEQGLRQTVDWYRQGQAEAEASRAFLGNP